MGEGMSKKKAKSNVHTMLMSQALADLKCTSETENCVRQFSKVKIEEKHFENMQEIEIPEELKEISQKVNCDDFRTLKVLGRGMFGRVVLVENVKNKKLFALKTLKKDKIIRLLQVEHTKSERKVLEKLNHPFIVSLQYAFQTRKKLYIVLEYVGGGDLFQHLSIAEFFPEPRACFYAAEILLVFEFLHSKNILYRDLKPENVMISEEGHVKITDFGLAKEVKISDKGSTGTFCGTNEYIAPELILGKPYGESVDWWALGILIYEMLTGWPPWSDDNKDVLFKKIMVQPMPDHENLSPNAKNLLTIMLMKNPKDRIKPSDIKKHPFFESIDFNALLAKKIKPPFKPDLVSPTDDKYFDPSVIKEDPMKESPAVTLPKSKKESSFNNFSFSPCKGATTETLVKEQQ